MEEEPVETAETKEEFIKCPCCGEFTLRKPLDIKSIVLDEYMASIITGVPFEHTYTLHDSIDVTVRIPLKREYQKLMYLSQDLENIRQSAKQTRPDVAAQLKNVIDMIQIYGGITTISTRSKDGASNKIYRPAEAVDKFIDGVKEMGLLSVDKLLELYKQTDTVENMSALPELMLTAVVKVHNDLYKVLLDTGFTETFWRGIELA